MLEGGGLEQRASIVISRETEHLARTSRPANARGVVIFSPTARNVVVALERGGAEVSGIIADATGGFVAGRRVGVVLPLAPAASIVGGVVVESGEPVPGAHVIAKNPNGTRAPTRSVETDEAGRFVLGELPAGGYEVSATSERLRAESSAPNVPARAARARSTHPNPDMNGYSGAYSRRSSGRDGQ